MQNLPTTLQNKFNMTEFQKNKPKSGPPGGNSNKNKPQGKGPRFGFYWIYILIAAVFILLNFFPRDFAQEANWMEVREMLSEGDIERFVVVNQEKVEVFIKKEALEAKDRYEDFRERAFYRSGEGPHYAFYIGDAKAFEENVNETVDRHELAEIPIVYDKRRNWTGDILTWVIFIAIMVAIWIFLMRRLSGGSGPGGQIFNVGKSKATLFDKDTDVKIGFKDVAGLDEAKEEVMEVVDFLRNPAKYARLGGKIPKGILFIGPPGTGKTLIAKAVAGEASVPFFSISGSDFVEMFVGVGASRVRDLFRQAKEKAPCIIFIDEIDAIGRARGKNSMHGANDERENTLNQLLAEMDGFSTNSGVIVLAATNRVDVLDKALLRPGRFDRQIGIDNPDLKAREEILKVHMKPLKVNKDVDPMEVAAQTPGFAGAELANICNEAALIAARKKRKSITMQDFQDAIDRVIGGLEKRNMVISKDEKRIVAFHEAGHALAGWFLKHASPLMKVSIVPRGSAALGYAQYTPKEQFLYTREQLYDTIRMTLGGRVAEELVFNEISTGAQNDLERVTQMSIQMISRYGMNEKVGHVSFPSNQNEWGFQRPFSEKTAQLIDEEMRKYIDKAYQSTKELLKDKIDYLHKIAEVLIKKEVIFRNDLEKILGKRPFDKQQEKDMEDMKKAGKKMNSKPKPKAKRKTKSELKEKAASKPDPKEEKKSERKQSASDNKNDGSMDHSKGNGKKSGQSQKEEETINEEKRKTG
jgi:AFG3 family protein